MTRTRSGLQTGTRFRSERTRRRGARVAVGVGLAALALFAPASAPRAEATPAAYSPHAGWDHPTRVLFGDTHNHTANSGDAIGFGARLGPEDAYRFARGETVVTSTGQPVRLSRPLDFLVVADHAEGLGIGREILAGNPALMSDATLRRWHELMQGEPEERQRAATEIISAQASGTLPAPIMDPKVAGPILRSVWHANNATAERFNAPGRFSALIGYEWTSVPGGNNLHRVVIFRDGAERTDRILPFSAHRSEDPADLWAFLARYEEKTGGRVLAIPHNGNLSNGRMFARVDFNGAPIDRAYAERRARWEPLYETTQIKGDSEAHPLLSPDDAFADYEKAGWDIGNLTLEQAKQPQMLGGEYAREALKRGLQLGARLGVNPFAVGLIGSSDSHTGVAAVEEASFFGKNALVEPRPGRALHQARARGGLRRMDWQYGAAGFAAVWARENTREAIFDALARRETYATTGTRMTVRFFGGFDFVPADAQAPDPARPGYRKGVPMGDTLSRAAPGQAPRFLVAAQRDPLGAHLDRIQIVKGWLDNAGGLHERIFDVVWANAEQRPRSPDGRIPPVGNSVDVQHASWTNDIGDPLLATTWRDPDFQPDQPAFYYARVLEIPTPRWTTYDAARFGTQLPPEVPRTIQERAYTSPIWYAPR